MKKMKAGFTLVEVTIATAFSAILIAGVFSILLVSNKQLQILHAKMSLEEGPREALFKMAQEIRQTAEYEIQDFSVGNSLSGNAITFRVPVPAPDASTLVDASYVPLWAATVTYSLDTSTQQILRTSVEDGVTKQAILANNVTALEFSRSSANSALIMIRIEAQQILSDGRRVPEQPMRFTTQAEARNP